MAYLDLTGRGAESTAHIRANGRVVVMFCAFDGPPRIVRRHGRGRVVPPGDPDWASLTGLFPPRRGARAVVRVDVGRVSSSCGFGVPLHAYDGDRDRLERWTERTTREQPDEYRGAKNSTGIDGLPALPG